MTAFARESLLSVLALAVSGCSIVAPKSCTTSFVYGLAIVVKDSISTAGIASGATALARDGTFVDSVSVPANRPVLDSEALLLAGQRGGTYTVTVRKSGYHDWTRLNVQVATGPCHPLPVTLTALLQRLSG